MGDITFNLIAGGLGAGIIYGATKYMNNRKNGEAFAPLKLAKTIVLGALAGVLATFTGMDISAEAVALEAAGFSVAAENIIKFFKKKPLVGA